MTWLLSIARFKALSALRRRVDEALDDEASAALADPADDPEATVQKKGQERNSAKVLDQTFASSPAMTLDEYQRDALRYGDLECIRSGTVAHCDNVVLICESGLDERCRFWPINTASRRLRTPSFCMMLVI